MLSRAAALEKQMESQLERQQAEVPKFAAAVVSQFVVVATLLSMIFEVAAMTVWTGARAVPQADH